MTDSLILRELERTTKLLKAEVKDPITTITLHEFHQRAWPLLQNIGEDFIIADWVAITGHPFVQLDVMDEQGKIKYSIPPILQPQRTSTDHEVHLVDISTELQAARADSPAYANRMIWKMLNNLSDKEYDGNADATAFAAVLNQIFTDHGMPAPFPTVVPATPVAELPAPAAEIIIDGYDDL